MSDWTWLEKEILPHLSSFDKPEEVTEFVTTKVESLLAAMTLTSNPKDEEKPKDSETLAYQHASEKFHKFFKVGHDDKLVTKMRQF